MNWFKNQIEKTRKYFDLSNMDQQYPTVTMVAVAILAVVAMVVWCYA